MKTFDYNPIPITVPVGKLLFDIYYPSHRTMLHKEHPNWWWMYTWASGVLLSWELTQLVELKKILEIGCGLGLSSIVASKLGHDITCVDMIEETKWYVEHNARMSDTKIPTWKHISQINETFEYIIFSDVLYANFRAPEAFIDSLRLHLSENGEILCVEPNHGPIISTFISAMEVAGFVVHEHTILPSPKITNAPWETDTYIKLRMKRA
jgi:predicted nicotinamide N-methyase